MALIHSILLGAVGGMRAMTPLATVANAARAGKLPRNSGAPRWMGKPAVAIGASAMAAAEIAGDKMKTAPDRIVAIGMLARLTTGVIAGVAMAPVRKRAAGAVLGATAAVGAAYLTFSLRKRAMRRFGQTATGAVEDAVTVGSAALIAYSASRD